MKLQTVVDNLTRCDILFLSMKIYSGTQRKALQKPEIARNLSIILLAISGFVILGFLGRIDKETYCKLESHYCY